MHTSFSNVFFVSQNPPSACVSIQGNKDPEATKHNCSCGTPMTLSSRVDRKFMPNMPAIMGPMPAANPAIDSVSSNLFTCSSTRNTDQTQRCKCRCKPEFAFCKIRHKAYDCRMLFETSCDLNNGRNRDSSGARR